MSGGDLDVAMRLRLINMLSGPANAAERDIKDIGRAAQSLNGARAGTRIAADLRTVSRNAADAERHLKALSRTGIIADEVAGRLGAGGLMSMGARAGVAGVALIGLTAAVGGATKEAIQFETAMADVKKAVDMDPAAFDRLQDSILKISRTTGMSKEQVAQLTAQAGFAGRPAEDLTRFATFAAKAAIAFDMTAEAAGDGLAKLGNIFKLTQVGIEDAADAINLLGDSTASKEREIVDFLQRVGAASQTFGLSIDKTAAFGAAIVSLGTTPEIAATGFNALITKLQTASKQGKDFQAGLKTLGLTGKQVAALIQKGPAEAILELMDRINKLDPNKRASVLVDMFGGEYADDMARLAGATDQLRRALGLVADQSNRAGGVEKTFSIFNATTEAKIKRVSAQVEALGTNLGNMVTPALGASAEALSAVLEKLNAAFDRQREMDRQTPSERAWSNTTDRERQAEETLRQREQGLRDAEATKSLSRPAREAMLARIDEARKALEEARGLRDSATQSLPNVQRALDAVGLLPTATKVKAGQKLPPRPIPDPRRRAPDVPDIEDYVLRQSQQAKEARVSEIEGRIRDREVKLQAEADRHSRDAEGPQGAAMRRLNRELARRAQEALASDQELKWMREELARAKADLAGEYPAAPEPKAAPRWDPDAIQKNHFGVDPQDAEDAGKRSGAAFEGALRGELGRAEQEVAAFSNRLQQMLSFNATPTISPRFSGPAGTPASAPAGGEAAPAREARRGGGAPQVTTTVHVHGVQDPAAFGRQLARIQDQQVRSARNGALHDTGAIA